MERNHPMSNEDPKPARRRSPWYAASAVAAVVVVGGGVTMAAAAAPDATVGAAQAAPTSGSTAAPTTGSKGAVPTDPAERPAHQPHIGGTVTKVSGSTITVKDHDGFTRVINTSSGDTTFEDGLKMPIAVGTNIEARGTVNADGVSLDATTVGTRPEPGKDGGRGHGPGGPGRGFGPRGGGPGEGHTPPSGAPTPPSGAPAPPSAAPSASPSTSAAPTT